MRFRACAILGGFGTGPGQILGKEGDGLGKELHATVRSEEGSLRAAVEGLPGCFASGRTGPELVEALQEAIAMSIEDDGVRPDGIRLGLSALPIAVPA